MKARFLTIPFALVALLLFTAQGCGSDDDPASFGGGSGKKKDGGGSAEGEICLLNNCSDDIDCTDCDGERTTCYQAEKRCVACGPNAGGKTCKAGSYCTKYGDCVPNSVKCEEDANGNPLVICRNTADCGACGPSFKVCDEASQRCVGCTAENTSNCQSTDTCKNNTCLPKCPTECEKDEDCGECGPTGGREVRACNRHICAQCSATKACPDGQRCDLEKGTCIKPCGVIGQSSRSSCTQDGNCSGCTGTTKCKVPVNGGEGKCAAPAPGCSDLGKFAVLPSPFDRVTNLCSNDTDCANVNLDFNIGKELREATGLGLIKDANISYGMRACASVEVLDKSCGVCVPCKQDSDCQDIDILKVAGDMFGPLGSIGARILLDKAFGPSDRKVHMFCQGVAGDYGVCLPCPNMLQACAQSNASVPPSGECSHDVCELGGPLGINCSIPCVAKVCEKDPYCCTDKWDEQCKLDVDLVCNGLTCEADKCILRPAGWYCFSDPTQGGFLCDGDPGNEQISGGRQCEPGRVCKKTGPGPKDPAQLCETESDSDPACPIGTKGKPKCLLP